MRLTAIKAVVLAGVLALAGASPAQAWWWRGGWGGWNAYWPYGWSYYGYYPGYYYGSYPSYYPYYSYAYSPYYTYSTLYPTGYAYAPTYAAPQTLVAAPATTTYQSFYPPDTALSTLPSANEAIVRVQTAPDAQLWFDGVAMDQKGPIRSFSTPGLKPGDNYKYDVKVRWMDNGTPIERHRTVTVRAGNTVNVDLTPDALR